MFQDLGIRDVVLFDTPNATQAAHVKEVKMNYITLFIIVLIKLILKMKIYYTMMKFCEVCIVNPCKYVDNLNKTL